VSTPLPAGLDVSCETEARLRHFATLVEKWSRRINLVSPVDLPQIWNRHILDSVQLARFAPDPARSWLDLGSGGGFPGLVLAILFREHRPGLAVTLVESDRRKAAFLHYAAQELGIAPRILTDRAEELAPQGADVLSARALASLTALLAHAARHLAPDGIAVFPKGRNWQAEVDEAHRHWQFALAIHDSLTDHEARILIAGGVSRA